MADQIPRALAARLAREARFARLAGGQEEEEQRLGLTLPDGMVGALVVFGWGYAVDADGKRIDLSDDDDARREPEQPSPDEDA